MHTATRNAAHPPSPQSWVRARKPSCCARKVQEPQRCRLSTTPGRGSTPQPITLYHDTQPAARPQRKQQSTYMPPGWHQCNERRAESSKLRGKRAAEPNVVNNAREGWLGCRHGTHTALNIRPHCSFGQHDVILEPLAGCHNWHRSLGKLAILGVICACIRCCYSPSPCSSPCAYTRGSFAPQWGTNTPAASVLGGHVVRRAVRNPHANCNRTPAGLFKLPLQAGQALTYSVP